MASSRQLPAPRWAGPDARRFEQHIEGARIEWVQAGSGPPLLLLHGYGGSARWWVRNLAPLARIHTVYALDLPGFGASRMPGPYTFERSIALLAAWMASNDITQACIVGHSMGGQVAMLFACEHQDRVRALILIAPAGLPLGAGLPGIARRAFGSRMGGDPRFTPIVVGGSLRAGPRVLWQAVQQIRGVDIRPHLASLAVPTFILWGEKDRLLPVAGAASLAAAIAGAEARIVPGANHNLFFDQAELVNEAILTFIATHEMNTIDHQGKR